MACPICDQKPMNCDCTPRERAMWQELQELDSRPSISRAAITPEEIEALRWGIRLMADAGMANSVETLKALMERLK